MVNDDEKAQINFAKDFATKFEFDQVVIIARRITKPAEEGGELVVTYGKGPENSSVAERMGNHLKYKVMGWKKTFLASN